MIQNEEWRPIKGFEGLYEVSNLGRIKSSKRILKQGINHRGYKYINICDKNKKWKQVEVHRLVALAFLCNEQNKGQVDHIDANKCNNFVDNLRWVTPKENSNNPNSLEHLRSKMKDEEFKKRRWHRRKEAGGATAPKTIFMYDKNNNFIREFSSITNAAKEFSGNNATISVAIDSKTRTAFGYKWYSKKIMPTLQ